MASVLVIGAGVGGLAAAARLARLGFQVTIVEKCEQAGGRCNRLEMGGHCFDTGPTLFLLPKIYASTFADLGERMEDHLDLRRIDPHYHIHFGDDSSLTLTSDLPTMRAQLEDMEAGSFGGFLRYLREAHFHHELALPHLAMRDFSSLSEFVSPKSLQVILRTKLLKKHYANMGHFFNDPRLKVAFSFQDLYMSLSPYESPATYSFLPYSEFADGVWFPMGGMYSIVQALMRIAESSGCRFMFDASVAQINVDDRQATGVTLADGSQMNADIVLANADLPYVYRCLLPQDRKSVGLQRKRYTCSVLAFYWGLDKQYPQFGAHNLFLATDYRQSWDTVLKDLTLPDDPSFYLHAPTRVDPSMAPTGADTLMVVVPVGHIDDNAPQDWPALQKRARQLVLQRLTRLGAHDLEQHIKFEVSYTPDDWLRRYNLTKGATLGLGHNLTQMGWFRPRNRHHRYRNLYFVGASTHPGSGVPPVLLSARFVTARVLQDAGVP